MLFIILCGAISSGLSLLVRLEKEKNCMYVWMLCLFLFPESAEVVKGASVLQTRLADQS